MLNLLLLMASDMSSHPDMNTSAGVGGHGQERINAARVLGLSGFSVICGNISLGRGR